jgi:hypothetical protein
LGSLTFQRSWSLRPECKCSSTPGFAI